MNNEELRERLEAITGVVHSVDTAWNEIDSLRERSGHTIHRVQCALTPRFNCYMFALGLHQREAWPEGTDIERDASLIDSCFLVFLERRNVLVRHDARLRQAGYIAAYYNHGLMVHAGVVQPDRRIVSKWGGGLLLNHEMLEVPSTYGDTVTCFEPPESEHLQPLLRAYVEFMRH
jgi:hypothetical protein